MPTVRANGIQLEYETFGDVSAAPLLLVMGLGAQMISWDEAFCKLLAARGFRVIRYDNRDCGLSTWMKDAAAPDVMAAVAGKASPAYMLEDMAADGAGLLDALGIPAAHVVGASMGGFIAQLIALNHPDRVLTLTSIMSGPGGTEATPPKPDGAAILLAAPPSTRDERIAQAMSFRKLLIGSADPYDEAMERARAERAVDRAYYPTGVGRQLVAVLAASGRLERLRSLRVPTLVVHGVDDILVPVENGRAVAAAVPEARLLELDGMGHDLPKRVWPQVIDAITDLAKQSNAAQRR